eukprot:gene24664-biopygen19441
MLARTFFKHPVRCGAVPPAAHEVVHDPKRGGLVWLVGAVPLAPAVAGRVCRWRKKMCSAVGAGVGGGGDNISSFVAAAPRKGRNRGQRAEPVHDGTGAPSRCWRRGSAWTRRRARATPRTPPVWAAPGQGSPGQTTAHRTSANGERRAAPDRKAEPNTARRTPLGRARQWPR